MSLDETYLEYPRMQHGMDHARYDWALLEQRPAPQWPGGAPLALWINVCVEHFPLNPNSSGFRAPGNMSMPYPDLRHYTLRDYGNRVGIFRILQALESAGFAASFAVNGELARRYPYLLQRLAATGGELLGHGWNMDCAHSAAVDEASERRWISDTLGALGAWSATPLRGWLSPARSQSARTPELLAAAGLSWCADWVNDELPYRFRTEQGELINLPLPLELEDRFIIGENLHSETEYADQLIDAADFLLAEALQRGGRLLSLNLHPWVIGQPHRIGQLERVLAHLRGFGDQLWNAGPSHILAASGLVADGPADRRVDPSCPAP